MGQTTKISWTDATWSPLRTRVRQNAAEIARAKGYSSLVSIAERMAGHAGPHCETVSEGCRHCYSAANNHRCLPANGPGRRPTDLAAVRSIRDQCRAADVRFFVKQIEVGGRVSTDPAEWLAALQIQETL